MKDNLRKIKYSISSENNIRNLENEEDINTQVKTFSWKLINPLIQHKDKIAYVLGRIGIVVVWTFYIIDYSYRIKCEQFYKNGVKKSKEKSLTGGWWSYFLDYSKELIDETKS